MMLRNNTKIQKGNFSKAMQMQQSVLLQQRRSQDKPDMECDRDETIRKLELYTEDRYALMQT
jgi:hypothetical protein